MNGVAVGAGGVLLAAVLAGGGFFYVKDLRADLTRAEADVKAARDATAERDTTIRQLRERARRNDIARLQLEAERTRIRASLDTRETQIRKLESENAEMRTWAAAPLPGPLVRLLDHGPITGAAAYRERMPADPAVHAAGGDGRK